LPVKLILSDITSLMLFGLHSQSWSSKCLFALGRCLLSSRRDGTIKNANLATEKCPQSDNLVTDYGRRFVNGYSTKLQALRCVSME